jgi:8-oxo-dGTP pyrophosphatase MutT (NUDIX family)
MNNYGRVSEPVERRVRRTARIVLLGPDDRLLLFRYLAEGFDPFWIMPGGECDPGEDYPAGARRELREETGIVGDPLPLGVTRQADYIYAGEPVRAIEHFFVHRTEAAEIDTAGHTELELQAMQEHRWFTRVEIGTWPETIYPSDILDLIDRAQGSVLGTSRPEV